MEKSGLPGKWPWVFSGRPRLFIFAFLLHLQRSWSWSPHLPLRSYSFWLLKRQALHIWSVCEFSSPFAWSPTACLLSQWSNFCFCSCYLIIITVKEVSHTYTKDLINFSLFYQACIPNSNYSPWLPYFRCLRVLAFDSVKDRCKIPLLVKP